MKEYTSKPVLDTLSPWEPTPNIVNLVPGYNEPFIQALSECDYVYEVHNVGDHWILCAFDLHVGEILVYDSLP